jgi:hypothetical protein
MTRSNIPTNRNDLNNQLVLLRKKEGALIEGSNKLCAYGITSHTNEVITALNAIRAEAHHIANRLDAIGETDDATNARHGWALILPPPPGATR